MSDVLIQQIRVDENGRLRLRPLASTYPFIHRDASSVRWDESASELHVLADAQLDALAEFRQIVNAVEREYGDCLLLSSSAQFVDMPHELIAAITRSAE